MLMFLLLPDASPVKRPIDDTLIRQIAEGSMEALHTLYDSIHGQVYGFALSITKNTHDADDVLQETFLKVYAKAGDYTPQGKPLAWIFTIARHLAMDKHREHARRAPLDDARHETVDFRETEDIERRLLLEELFKALTEEEREIVLLHTVNGMRHREIAAILELPLGTVLSKYHRAIKHMKEATKEMKL